MVWMIQGRAEGRLHVCMIQGGAEGRLHGVDDSGKS